MYKVINDIKTYGNYIDDKWVIDEMNVIKMFAVADNQHIGNIQRMSKADIDHVYAVAHANKQAWANVPTYERARILYRTADLLVERTDEIAQVMMQEIGKDLKSCKSEVKRTVDFIRYSADIAKAVVGESLSGDFFPGYNQNKWALVSRVPMGVVLAISPFNYPVNLAASKIAPALAIGNCVVVKPATQGAMSTLHLIQAFIDAGVPRGVLSSVTGEGREIGDYLVEHPSVDFVNFTGSSAVGRGIAKKITMKPLLMELGGKDAAIVLADADLDLAAKEIIGGAYSYSGQRCTAVKRILVVPEVADELVKKLQVLVKGIKSGMPDDEGVVVTPLITTKAADYVMELIDDATNKGANFVVEGKRTGNLITPYLVDNVTTDMRLAWEEPFGPVLPILRVKDAEEAIEIANRSEYGLQSSIFTKDLNLAMQIAGRLEVGTVQLNNKTERGPDHFPFTGIKSSGVGTQGIRYSIEAMSRLKSFVLNTKEVK